MKLKADIHGKSLKGKVYNLQEEDLLFLVNIEGKLFMEFIQK